MNLACPDCASPLRDDGHCDRCSSTYDDIVGASPDPYDVAGGLDLRAAEDDHQHSECQRRSREHVFAAVRDGWARDAALRDADAEHRVEP